MAQKLKIDIVAKDRSKQALQGLQGSLGRLKASVFNLRNAFIGLGAGLVIRNIVNTGKQIENLQVQLKFLFGSAQEGAKAFDEMAKFASKVPFSLEEKNIIFKKSNNFQDLNVLVDLLIMKLKVKNEKGELINAFDPFDKIALKKKADSNVIATIANRILADTQYEEAEKK